MFNITFYLTNKAPSAKDKNENISKDKDKDKDKENKKHNNKEEINYKYNNNEKNNNKNISSNSIVETFFDDIEYYTDPEILITEINRLGKRDIIIIDYSSRTFDPIIFTEKVKSISQDTAVILVMEKRKRAAEAYKVGADDYILKPLNLERLHKAVKNINHRREDA